MVKRMLGIAVGVFALLLLVAGPASAQYQPTGSQVLSETVVDPGATITVSGSGCPAGSTVTTAFDGTVLGTSTADGGGAFTVTVTIPTDATPGTHTITSTCGATVLSSTITVQGAGGTTGSGTTGTTGSGTGTSGNATLARTGSPTTTILRFGFVLVAAGGAFLVVARTRRRDHAA